MESKIKVKSAPTGIIMPPKDLIRIIDCTAGKVAAAEKGSTFEEIVIKKFGKDKKF